MEETREILDYTELENNLNEERLREKDECQAVLKYVIDGGLFLEEDVEEALEELDYKINEIDTWLMLRPLLEMLKMEYTINSVESYYEQWKEGLLIPDSLEKHINIASILWDEIQGNRIAVFRKGKCVSVLEVIYPLQ